MTLEVIAQSVYDAHQARSGGADRVELVSAIFLGGLTPSHGLVAEVCPLLPAAVMIRPRPGGFDYEEAEISSMIRDIKFAADCGAVSVVFGVLTPSGELDLDRCRRLIESSPLPCVLHRAVDATADPVRSFDLALEIGFTRVLSSGGASTAWEGRGNLAKMAALQPNAVLAGGGLRPQTIREFIAATGINQIHGTAFETVADTSTQGAPHLRYGSEGSPPESEVKRVSAEVVRAMRAAMS
jgi:copper homeostasis protein